MSDVTNLIAMWSGTIGDVPAGWALCDGTVGTPDLRRRFLRGAKGSFNPGDLGGSASHNHNFTTNGHGHGVIPGPGFFNDGDFSPTQATSTDSGTTDQSTVSIPFYFLAFIMRLP